MAGFLHPIRGLDHVVAMVAVGLWGAALGAPALWVLPVTFPMVMAFGGLLGLLGVPIPGVEIGIAVSGLLMGLMVLFELRPPLWRAAFRSGGRWGSCRWLPRSPGCSPWRRARHWPAIGLRVGGSWITAASLLVLVWRMRHPPGVSQGLSSHTMEATVPAAHALEATRKVRWGAGSSCAESGTVPQL